MSYYATGSKKDHHASRRDIGEGWLRRDVEKSGGSESRHGLTTQESNKSMTATATAAEEGYVLGPLRSEIVRTAEEYEDYVLRPLSRHKGMRDSEAVDVTEGSAVLFGEPFPAFEARRIEEGMEEKV